MSPFGATRMRRGFLSLEANTSALKPGGSASLASFGRGTTRELFPADSVAKTRGRFAILMWCTWPGLSCLQLLAASPAPKADVQWMSIVSVAACLWIFILFLISFLLITLVEPKGSNPDPCPMDADVGPRQIRTFNSLNPRVRHQICHQLLPHDNTCLIAVVRAAHRSGLRAPPIRWFCDGLLLRKMHRRTEIGVPNCVKQ